MRVFESGGTPVYDRLSEVLFAGLDALNDQHALGRQCSNEAGT